MIAKKLTIELLSGQKKLLEQAKEIRIATALISDWALDFVVRNAKNTKPLKILLGINLPSSMLAMEKMLQLQDEGKLECRLYVSSFFHCKLYLFEADDFKRGYIGSGNFTRGGFVGNVELFHRTDIESDYDSYREWFECEFEKAVPLSQQHINILQPVFERKSREQQKEAEEVKIISDIINGRFNLDAIDFTGQFFQKEHFETFSLENRTKDGDALVTEMRKNVKKRFFDLHDLVFPEIKRKSWNLHPHYQTDDIVSSTELSFHRSHEISSMWLHYGRDKKEIKAYGNDETPLFFSRLQVIIHYDDVGIWLRFGKSGGSRQDRQYFYERMKEPKYRQDFWDLLQKLGSEYFIRIGKENKKMTDFGNVQEVWDFTKTDNWRQDYFIIGRAFNPADKNLSEKNIVHTVMEEFDKLYPLYLHMKDKSFLSY